MNSWTVVARVNEILAEGFEIDPTLLSPDARLKEDLELDSLDGVDLVVAIEKAFSCRIQEADARSMLTLADVYRHIEHSLQAAGGDRQV